MNYILLLLVLDASLSISTSVSYFRRRSDLSTSPAVKKVGVILSCLPKKQSVVTSEPLARVVQLTVQEQGMFKYLVTEIFKMARYSHP